MHKHNLSAIAFFFAAALIFFGLWFAAQKYPTKYPNHPSLYESIEQSSLRWKLKFVKTPRPSSDVVVVGIDDATFGLTGTPPLPRDVYADIIAKLREYGAETIALNMIFADPHLEFLAPSAFSSLYPSLPLADIRVVNKFNYLKELRAKLDAEEKKVEFGAADGMYKPEYVERFKNEKEQFLALIESIARGAANAAFEKEVSLYDDIVLCANLYNKTVMELPPSEKEAVERFMSSALPLSGVEEKLYPKTVAETLYPQLFDSQPIIGVNEIANLERPFVCSAWLLVNFKGRAFAGLIPYAIANFKSAPLEIEGAKNGKINMKVGRLGFQTGLDGRFPLLFYNDADFPKVVSARSVLTKQADAVDIEGKLVIVDVRAASASGYLQVPTPTRERMWVSDVKATLASNILQGHRGPDDHRPVWLLWLEGGLIWLYAAILAWFSRRQSLAYSLVVGAAMLAAVSLVDFLLLLPRGYWMSSAILVIEVPLLMVANVIAHYVIQTAERQKVRRAFGFYLPSNVLEHVLKNEDSLKFGGERKELSILFSDIRGFTSISEATDAETLTHMLNVHLNTLTQVVFANSGTLDKYIGDCIMAFFGAPAPMDDHAYRAVKCALDMQAGLRKIRPQWFEACRQNVKIGVGVASGDVLISNMGSETLFDYTVIGDKVNLASRLEGLTKEYGVDVLVSQLTRQKVTDGVHFLEIDAVKVKGRDTVEKIYEAVCLGEPDETRKSYDGFITEAIAAYRAGRFEEAAVLFKKASAVMPDMKLPHLYADRIEKLQAEGVPEGWNGVTVFDHK